MRYGRTEVALDVSLAVLAGEGDFLIDLNDEGTLALHRSSVHLKIILYDQRQRGPCVLCCPGEYISSDG